MARVEWKNLRYTTDGGVHRAVGPWVTRCMVLTGLDFIAGKLAGELVPTNDRVTCERCAT